MQSERAVKSVSNRHLGATGHPRAVPDATHPKPHWGGRPPAWGRDMHPLAMLAYSGSTIAPDTCPLSVGPFWSAPGSKNGSLGVQTGTMGLTEAAALTASVDPNFLEPPQREVRRPLLIGSRVNSVGCWQGGARSFVVRRGSRCLPVLGTGTLELGLDRGAEIGAGEEIAGGGIQARG